MDDRVRQAELERDIAQSMAADWIALTGGNLLALLRERFTPESVPLPEHRVLALDAQIRQWAGCEDS